MKERQRKLLALIEQATGQLTETEGSGVDVEDGEKDDETTEASLTIVSTKT